MMKPNCIFNFFSALSLIGSPSKSLAPYPFNVSLSLMDLCGDESQSLDLKYDIQNYQALLKKLFIRILFGYGTNWCNFIYDFFVIFLMILNNGNQDKLVREQFSHFLPFHVLYLLFFLMDQLSIILTDTLTSYIIPVFITPDLVQCILTRVCKMYKETVSTGIWSLSLPFTTKRFLLLSPHEKLPLKSGLS